MSAVFILCPIFNQIKRSHKFHERNLEMPTNWDAVNAQCPFYLTETINTITCEGIIGQTDVHGFHLRTVKAEHKNKFCNRCFKRCKYYIALIDEKYPEEKPSAKKR
jgi:hypothetical protein